MNKTKKVKCINMNYRYAKMHFEVKTERYELGRLSLFSGRKKIKNT